MTPNEKLTLSVLEAKLNALMTIIEVQEQHIQVLSQGVRTNTKMISLESQQVGHNLTRCLGALNLEQEFPTVFTNGLSEINSLNWDLDSFRKISHR